MNILYKTELYIPFCFILVTYLHSSCDPSFIRSIKNLLKWSEYYQLA